MINLLKAAFFRNKFYVSVCAIVKDENAYLKEWLEYHLQIGVAHFFIYDNGSKIPIAATINALGYAGQVTVVDFQGDSMQNAAYAHCLKKFGTASQWIAFIDIDEFIVPKTDNHDLNLFLRNYENYGGIGVNWLVFGSNGQVAKSENSQLEQFTMRAKNNFSVNNHIKSIVQPKFVRGVKGPHHFKYIPGKFCVNEHFEKIGGATSDFSTQKIHINHYFCRSLEEYKEKLSRGRADGSGEGRDLDRFHHFDKYSNDVEDRTILDIRAAKSGKEHGH